jgi:hypothetical protein
MRAFFKKRWVKVSTAILLGVLLLVGLWFAAPSVARWYVLRNYPDVKSIGEIWFHTNKVEVWDVHVERPGIVAHLDYVSATYDKQVEVLGGNVQVNIDQLQSADRPDKKEDSGLKLSANSDPGCRQLRPGARFVPGGYRNLPRPETRQSSRREPEPGYQENDATLGRGRGRSALPDPQAHHLSTHLPERIVSRYGDQACRGRSDLDHE